MSEDLYYLSSHFSVSIREVVLLCVDSLIYVLLLQGQWFFALMACLEKPLVPEACSLLRELARNCANLRATLVRILFFSGADQEGSSSIVRRVLKNELDSGVLLAKKCTLGQRVVGIWTPWIRHWFRVEWFMTNDCDQIYNAILL